MRASSPRMTPRVLVIDDNTELLALYETVLRWNGFRPTTMDRPPATLEAVRDLRPVAVILDLHFGGQQFEGWRFLQRLRSDSELERLPVIVCTAGVAEVAGTETLLLRHNVRVLTKPFLVSDLERLLAEALSADAQTDGIGGPELTGAQPELGREGSSP